MPAYLRKAFSFGPFRLNLSKSGLGLSFGVTGLRIGTGPKGPYIHAGRGGLYFRKSLNDVQDNQNEIIEEEIETPTEPQPIWKKIYVYGANFFVASFIIMLVITIIFIYFSIDFLKFAAKADRSNKRKKNKMKKFLFTILLIFISSSAYAARQYNEAYYQEKWCSDKGITEYKLEDYTRVDCLTETHAVEFDFAKKWAESIGQSLHYSRMTKKKPGIVLIIEKPKDFVYYDRIKPLCEQYGITLWHVEGMEYEAQK